MSRRGRFITFEGGEGAGKSTQAVRLAEHLRADGIDVVLTREPGGNRRGEVLRELLLTGRVAPFGPQAEALLFAIARAEHVAETIRPALSAGKWVISDRFLDSTWAYQGSEGVSEAELERLDAIAVGACRPDLTLILDIDPLTALERLRARGGVSDRFEADALTVHQRRREAFVHRARREPRRCALVDASRRPEEVAADIRAIVAERLAPVPAEAD